MNSARLAHSERLQRVDSLLSDGRWHSTLDILTGARICAVNSAISELRANGRPIVCRRDGDVWFYRQVPRAELVLAP